MKHLLVIDDDALMRRSLGFNLEQTGFRVSSAASAEDGLEVARRDPPHLVLLDINLPGMDGLDALKRMRDEFHVPVIFVTARRRELDQVLGLELGADDYVTKPFDFDVLLARVKAVLRRAEPAPAEVRGGGPVRAGRLVVDYAAHRVLYDGVAIELAPREFDLLHELARESGKVISSADLLARVWGPDYVGEPQVLYVHIRWLREKLEKNPQKPELIQTVRGVGYKLNPEVRV